MQRGDTFLCGTCGARSTEGVAGICGCGITLAEGTRRVLPFRCERNPNPTPDAPARFGIAFGTAPAPVGKAA